MSKPEVELVSLRFPPELKEYLARSAKANYRSMNAEMLALIKARMDADREKAAS